MISAEYIKDRAAELRRLREESRAALRALGAKDDTPLLQAVCFAADDLDAVAGELERLSSQASGATLLNAVLGSLRADGYTVLAPGFDVPAAEEPADDYIADSPQCGTFMGIELVPAEEEPLPEATPASYQPMPPSSLGSGDYGPDSFGGQDAPHAPAVTPEPPVELHRGMTVQLVGNGLYAGRHAILHDKAPTGIWFGELTGSRFIPTKPAPTLPLGSFATTLPDPDKQPSLFTNTAPAPAETKAPDVAPAEVTATAPKPTRSPEADKPVSDWNPSDKEIGEMAAIVGHTIERTGALIATFKADNATAKPQARWRVPFVKWAKTQPKE